MSVRIVNLRRFLSLLAGFRGPASGYGRMSSGVGSPLSPIALLGKGELVITGAQLGMLGRAELVLGPGRSGF